MDPFLPKLTSEIFEEIYKYSIDFSAITDNDTKRILQYCLYLGKLIYVRGRKKIEKYFPHEVKDLRIVLGLGYIALYWESYSFRNKSESAQFNSKRIH